jgi:hypothetical protein
MQRKPKGNLKIKAKFKHKPNENETKEVHKLMPWILETTNLLIINHSPPPIIHNLSIAHKLHGHRLSRGVVPRRWRNQIPCQTRNQRRRYQWTIIYIDDITARFCSEEIESHADSHSRWRHQRIRAIEVVAVWKVESGRIETIVVRTWIACGLN